MHAYSPKQKDEPFLVGFIKTGWPIIGFVLVVGYVGFNVAAYIAIATGGTGELHPVLHALLIWALRL